MIAPQCETILVVEDDLAICNAIKQALEIEGFRVSIAEDGKRALKTLETLSTPCLILLDLMMPIMNGWEFLEEIKKRGHLLATIPIVITSAALDAEKTASEKAQGFIKKPIDLDLLVSAVHKYCVS
jgi:CheY-like chemotaxis protein